MSVRKALLAVAALGLIASAVPATAEEGLGVATQFAGEIVATTESLTTARGDSSHIGTTELAGKCAYVGVTTLTGQIQFAFGGATESYSTIPASVQPIGTRATCTLISDQQPIPGSPPTVSMVTDIRMSGAAAATPPALTPPWPLRPVRICVSGDAQYGPTPADRTLAQICTTAAITPTA